MTRELVAGAAGLLLLLAVPFSAAPRAATPIGRTAYVATTAAPGSFPLVRNRRAATLYVDATDWAGVVRAAGDLQADVNRVTGVLPSLVHMPQGLSGDVVIIGTVGKSPLIDRLAAAKRIDTSQIAGKWESYFLQTVANPVPGVAHALVIAGSDKRGTIYGIYDLSEQIGVSPWYWWDDVTPAHQNALFVKAGTYLQDEPSVKYRGIFLNDERPDLTDWVREKFGSHPDPSNPNNTVANFNSQFYGKVFELILRLKGNYLWPAMWNNAFAEDDPDNPRLADEYGIVMGTSHQEPMMRAQKEWDWHERQQYGNWNYATHPDVLNAFWRDGVKARKDYENLYTIGLRGENDSAMVQGPQQSMALLDQIVDAQRKILAEEVNPDVTQVPQLWCLYKEVQGYYESGLRVPDDVTLLWAEDNWGNVRRLPTAEERTRPGGAGIYYHFDYHGGPRSYQWVNTSPLAKIWDQMSLAKEYGADRVWIVNVGHLKGYELPTQYFLDLAWDTSRWTNSNIDDYTRQWAAQQFGAEYAGQIADIVEKYTKYNGRRKPELLDAGTYSLVNFQEADRVVADFQAITSRAEAIYDKLPAAKRDAFFELVLFPTKASAQVNEMYVAAAKNALYAAQGRADADDFAERTRSLFQADADLTAEFNKTAGGKWDHFMDQPHIGYRSWADPPQNNLSAIHLTEPTVPSGASMGVAVDGSTEAWPGASDRPTLPGIDAFNRQRRYIDVFDRGADAFAFSAEASAPWIQVSAARGTVAKDTRLWVTVDWSKAPAGSAEGTIHVSGAGGAVDVGVSEFNPAAVTRATLRGFVETNGYVSIEPEHYSKKTDAGASRWIKVEDYGRTLSGMRATSPVDAPSATPGSGAPSLEYRMYLFTPGAVTTALTLAPTLNFVPDRGLRLAVSFDDEAPQVVTAVPANYNAQNGNRDWEETVRDNARVVTAQELVAGPGYHTLKVWMVDPAVLVQKIVVRTSAARDAASYLGPPETYHARAAAPSR